ncbi:MAG: hypothetical protein EPN25_00945 [Nitrospirae bacterium]|nr:MAG: hypothetical protein EPN25_00945 [Nitrospirota bacterium]
MKRTAPAKNCCLLFLLVSLTAAFFSCVTTGARSGPPKNSLPVVSREMLEEVHTIAIPAFYGDRQNWRGISYEVLFASKRITVIPPDQVELAIKGSIKDFPSLRPEERGQALGKLGRNLKADAVLNGVILTGEDQDEVLLQLISLKDSKIIFMQAVDLSPKDAQFEHEQKKTLISGMLAPVLEHAGKRKKLVPPPSAPKEVPVIIVPQPEPQQPPVSPRPEPQPKKPRRGTRQSPAADSISPM